MRVDEVFNNQPSARWNWVTVSPAIMRAEVFVKSDKYNVDFYLYDNRLNAWSVEFSAMDRPDPFVLTNRGDSVQVLAAIIDVIRNGISKSGMDVLMFAAKEPSRNRVYAHILHRLGLSYETSTTRSGDTRYLVPTTIVGQQTVANLLASVNR